MDNLDSNGYGTSHGIRVQGAASHVAILNPTIEWVTEALGAELRRRHLGPRLAIGLPAPGWLGRLDGNGRLRVDHQRADRQRPAGWSRNHGGLRRHGH